MPKQYLTVKEVARLLEVTPLTVRNWDAKGKLTAHRHPMNNYRLYRISDVEKLLTELEVSKVAKKVASPPPEPARRELAEPETPQIRKLKIDVL